MFLSRIQLDEKRRATMIALSNPAMFHGAAATAFSGKRPHILWRIDTLAEKRYFMLLSEQKPDLCRVAAEFGTGEPAEIKSYDHLLDSITVGSRWNFRLCANPTYTVLKKGEKRGRLCAHTTNSYQRNWLLQQSEKHGFHLTDNDFDVVYSRWYNFGKADGNKVRILSVTFEGILQVTDVEQFKFALIDGIGRGKAYGMGLLTVMRIIE